MRNGVSTAFASKFNRSQAQRVGDNNERRTFMRRDCGTDTEPEDRRRHEDNNHAEAHDQILANDPPRLATKTDREGQMREIVCHQSNVGGFKSDI